MAFITYLSIKVLVILQNLLAQERIQIEALCKVMNICFPDCVV